VTGFADAIQLSLQSKFSVKADRIMTDIAALPNFQASEFGGATNSFFFDFARLERNSEIPRPFLHRHGYYHLLWMTNARGKHIIDFETFEVKPHSVFFLSPGQVHAWTSTVKASGFVMNFSAEFFLQMFPKVDELVEFPFFDMENADPVLYLSARQHATLFPLLQEVEVEFGNAFSGRSEVVRSFLLILLTRLRRLQPPRQTEMILPKNYSLAKRFKQLLEQRFLETGSIQEYATLLRVTERRLNEAVKSTNGKTATQLIHDRILLEAKRLLSQTDLGTSEIAYRLNFDDPAYFCRFFKKQVALTPTAFRNQSAFPFRGQ
jgi:AraC family transcriptional activator of pobA